MSEWVIQTKDLHKQYVRTVKEPGFKGSVKSLFQRKTVEKNALKGLTLHIASGELVGFIGPNGAGKTTLVKLLCGIIQPTSGSVTVLGHEPGRLENQFRNRYAVVMGQKSQLWWDLPALDTFRLNKEIYDIPEERFSANLDWYANLFGVTELLQVPVRTLSLGERMKMELIAALLHDPELIFLDEPTIGLDAIAQKQIRLALKEINRTRKVTVLLTSHDMEDIRRLCHRTVVINEGTCVYDGSLENLLQQYRACREIHVTLQEPLGLSLELPDNVTFVDRQPYLLHLRVPREETRATLATLISHFEMEDIRIEEEEIGNVIERIYLSCIEGVST